MAKAKKKNTRTKKAPATMEVPPPAQKVTAKAKREPNVVTKPNANGDLTCPRCGECKYIIHRYTSSMGRKQYTCISPTCTKNRARGRGFIVFSDGGTYPKKSLV